MLRRALKVFHWVVALLILFEEWGWVPLANALARIGPNALSVSGVSSSFPRLRLSPLFAKGFL